MGSDEFSEYIKSDLHMDELEFLEKKIAAYEKVLREYAKLDNWTCDKHMYDVFHKDYGHLEAESVLLEYGVKL